MGASRSRLKYGGQATSASNTPRSSPAFKTYFEDSFHESEPSVSKSPFGDWAEPGNAFAERFSCIHQLCCAGRGARKEALPDSSPALSDPIGPLTESTTAYDHYDSSTEEEETSGNSYGFDVDDLGETALTGGAATGSPRRHSPAVVPQLKLASVGLGDQGPAETSPDRMQASGGLSTGRPSPRATSLSPRSLSRKEALLWLNAQNSAKKGDASSRPMPSPSPHGGVAPLGQVLPSATLSPRSLSRQEALAALEAQRKAGKWLRGEAASPVGGSPRVSSPRIAASPRVDSPRDTQDASPQRSPRTGPDAAAKWLREEVTMTATPGIASPSTASPVGFPATGPQDTPPSPAGPWGLLEQYEEQLASEGPQSPLNLTLARTDSDQRLESFKTEAEAALTNLSTSSSGTTPPGADSWEHIVDENQDEQRGAAAMQHSLDAVVAKLNRETISRHSQGNPL